MPVFAGCVARTQGRAGGLVRRSAGSPLIASSKSRAARDAAAADEIDRKLADGRSRVADGVYVVWVIALQRKVPKGSKVWVSVEGRKRRQDCFVWWRSALPGELIIGVAGESHGEHSGRPDVLYVGKSLQESAQGLIAHYNADAVNQWKRHHRRVGRRSLLEKFGLRLGNSP